MHSRVLRLGFFGYRSGFLRIADSCAVSWLLQFPWFLRPSVETVTPPFPFPPTSRSQETKVTAVTVWFFRKPASETGFVPEETGTTARPPNPAARHPRRKSNRMRPPRECAQAPQNPVRAAQ